MKVFNKLAVAAVGVVLGFSGIQGQANAASLEMITNGEFEQTEFADKWTATSNVPGWETTRGDGKIELWNQGKINSPAIGSDGLGTGKHLETNYFGIQTISQTFTLGQNIDTTALFSFDAWSRKGGTGTVSVIGSLSGNILNQVFSPNGNDWTQNLFELSVMAGEEITVAFKGNQQDSSTSPHIDQVSFSVNELPESVPEPASMLGLLAVGAFGTASTLKRKKKQEA
ncbi:MAG: PEP-CTERM sorting domain-containing protein [Rivularia sp. (in: Bacteria)]|nr:PEP-CTERM sorting domain-containing protein [Rivularia sp. MS3]